jgi:phytoene synthase
MSTETTRVAELTAHYALCEAALRDKDRDLWLAALFAPRERRGGLHALDAFALEIEEIPAKVTQPLLGEMRLRWWADAIEAPGGAEAARAHPVLDALLDTFDAGVAAPGEASAFLDAHAADFYEDPTPDMPALLAYCDATQGTLMRWRARALGGDGATVALGDAGTALGLLKVLRCLPRGGGQFLPEALLHRHGASRQEVSAGVDSAPLRATLAELRETAQSRFEAARAVARELDEATRIALLSVATVPLYLEKMRARDYRPFGALREPSPLRRQWRLWRAARAGL